MIWWCQCCLNEHVNDGMDRAGDMSIIECDCSKNNGINMQKLGNTADVVSHDEDYHG